MKPTRTARLRDLLLRPELAFLMEAHNGLSARIVQEAGFEAIWASSLTMSASLGVRDNNEASWTQVLESVEFMSDACDIPILLDGDSGYGNFNAVRRLVRKLESRGVAGVCIEDKLFPKANSLAPGAKQTLVSAEEFAGKIKAAKDAQQDDAFVVVARTEAFIAGLGLSEAVARAEAYRAAGADAILIHSAQPNPSEIFAFARAWENRLPVVVVPTTYHATPVSAFAEQNVSAVIWANHLLRASVVAMQDAARRIFTEQGVGGVQDSLASIHEIFRLQNQAELENAERAYLPSAKDE